MFYVLHPSAHPSTRACACALLLASLIALGGCSAEDNAFSLNLGSVSVGAQLIDLKKAHDNGAINAAEYRSAKESLLNVLSNAADSSASLDGGENRESDDDASEQNDEQREEKPDSDFLF